MKVVCVLMVDSVGVGSGVQTGGPAAVLYICYKDPTPDHITQLKNVSQFPVKGIYEQTKDVQTYSFQLFIQIFVSLEQSGSLLVPQLCFWFILSHCLHEKQIA